MIITRKTLKALSYTEGLFHSLMVACTEVYALVNFARHDRDPLALGILTGLPQVLGSLFLLWAPAKVEKRHLTIGIGLSMSIQAMGVLTLFIGAQYGSSLFFTLAGLSLYWLGGQSTSSLWPDWMGPKFGPNQFGDFLASRNSFTMFGQLVFFVGFSFIAETYISFANLFMIGFLARLVSMGIQFFLFNQDVKEETDPYPRQSTAAVIPLPDIGDQKFWSFNIVTGIFRFTAGICSAYFLPYLLYDLKLTTQSYVFLAAIPMLARSIFVTKWARTGKIFGHLWGIEMSGIGVALLPVLWNFGDSYSYLIFLQVLAGLFWGGHEISTSLLVQDIYHGKSRRPIGLLQSTYTLAGLGGSFIGAALLKVVPDYHLLFSISSGLRLMSCGGMISFFNHFYGGTKFGAKASAAYVVSFIVGRPPQSGHLGSLRVYPSEEKKPETKTPPLS